MGGRITLEQVAEFSRNTQLYAFAKSICPQDNDFRFFHPAQLIKHILGLKRKYGHDGFRLLYLWYDVLGEEGKVHQDEITEFTAVAKNDGIKFHALSYQKLIISLASVCPGTPNYLIF